MIHVVQRYPAVRINREIGLESLSAQGRAQQTKGCIMPWVINTPILQIANETFRLTENIDASSAACSVHCDHFSTVVSEKSDDPPKA